MILSKFLIYINYSNAYSPNLLNLKGFGESQQAFVKTIFLR